jgi:hypothetical protein
MLAEIFMVRLEALARASLVTTSRANSQFVPFRRNDFNSDKLFKLWHRWATKNNAYIGSSQKFSSWMEERGSIKGLDKARHTIRVFKGLKFTKEVELFNTTPEGLTY